MSSFKTVLPTGNPTTTYIDLSSVTVSFQMDYNVDGLDLVFVQFDFTGTSVTWASATVLLELSADGVNYYSFPNSVEFTTIGVQSLVRVTGSKFVRLRNKTASAGDGKVVPVVRAGTCETVGTLGLIA